MLNTQVISKQLGFENIILTQVSYLVHVIAVKLIAFEHFFKKEVKQLKLL